MFNLRDLSMASSLAPCFIWSLSTDKIMAIILQFANGTTFTDSFLMKKRFGGYTSTNPIVSEPGPPNFYFDFTFSTIICKLGVCAKHREYIGMTTYPKKEQAFKGEIFRENSEHRKSKITFYDGSSIEPQTKKRSGDEDQSCQSQKRIKVSE
jgi:hypothetical protein